MSFVIYLQQNILTGNVPGNAESKNPTWVFTGDPNLEAALEKSLLSDAICAWISRPITGCQSSPLTLAFAEKNLNKKNNLSAM